MNSDKPTSLLRLIDANLNRVTEALRVVEDVCRFHWNLALAAASLQELRHRVFAALALSGLTRERLLAARDIEADVGRDQSIDAPSLQPADLAWRNLSRAKEALRVLQESCRIAAPESMPELEAVRYSLYGTEKRLQGLVQPPARAAALAAARVYLIATCAAGTSFPFAAVRAALQGGVRLVQLRAKGVSDGDVLQLGVRLRELTAEFAALLLINERPDIARIVHADGVHVGQDDLPLSAVREVAGEVLVGLSTHNESEIEAAERQGADYVGIGPLFPSSTKRDHETPLGVDRAAQLYRVASLPVFPIGGIQSTRLTDLRRVGIGRVAVGAAILDAVDPESAAAEFVRAMAPTSAESLSTPAASAPPAAPSSRQRQ